MENVYDSSLRSNHHYIAQNVWSVPGSLTHILEMEDADYRVGGVGATSDSTASGGYYQQFTWTGDIQTQVARFDLSTTLLGYARGNFFRLLTRFHTAPGSGIYLQPKITFPVGVPVTPVFEGAEVQLDPYSKLQDLGVVQLPPWLPGEADQAGVSLTIYGRKTGGGTLYWDFLQLSCLDGWRRLSPRGYGLAYECRLVDDGISGTVWTDGWSGGGKTGHYIPYGRPIHLWPGRDQRLYFLVDNISSGMQIERVYDVWVNYRPRRLTL